MGSSNLLNKIKKNRKGIFVHFKFEGDNKVIKSRKKISIDNNVIRFLTVKYKIRS